jgi:hypothetical protein
MRVLDLQALLARLEQQLTLLTGGACHLAVRDSRRYAARFGRIYHLLTPAERTASCQLAVFVGGYMLEVAQAELRYTMLETVGEFRLERLACAEELDLIRRAFPSLAQRVEPLQPEHASLDWLVHDNFRTARDSWLARGEDGGDPACRDARRILWAAWPFG